MYVVNTKHRSHVIRRFFACTHDELPRELAWAANINPIEMVGFQYVPNSQRHLSDMDLIKIYGTKTAGETE